MEQIKKRKMVRQITALLLAVIFLCSVGMVTAFAADDKPSGGGALAETTIVKGTVSFFEDASSVMLWLAPSLTALLCAYFGLRLSGSPDEQDKKAWTNRIKTALLALVFVFSISAIVNVAAKYYGGGSV